MDYPEIPNDVIRWVRKVFSRCDRSITRKLSKIPNIAEPSLDMTFIDQLTAYSCPRIFESGWSVRIDTHFLGGLRHWVRNWEIADIGILLHFQHGRKIMKSKAAVLQSKRLYANGHAVVEDLKVDYEMGFGRLHDPEKAHVPMHHEARYDFDLNSKYQALTVGSEQIAAIEQFSRANKVPVFYQFYNPLRLPFSQTFPVRTDDCKGRLILGTRIVGAAEVHSLIASKEKNYSPSVSDLSQGKSEFGWPLGVFVADLLLKCKAGYIYSNLKDENIFALFNRRSGPIAAGIAVVIESPG